MPLRFTHSLLARSIEMAFSVSPGSLARPSARHPWRVVGIWVVALVASFALMGSLLSDALTTEATATNNPDATIGQNLLEARLRGPCQAEEAVIVSSPSLSVDDPAFKAKVDQILGEIRALGPEVGAFSTSYYETNLATFVSQDGNA